MQICEKINFPAVSEWLRFINQSEIHKVEAETIGIFVATSEITAYRLRDKGKIRIIKFSPDERLISIQYNESAIVSVCQHASVAG